MIRRLQFPDGLGVRIPDSHSGGPGSIPGQGALLNPHFGTVIEVQGLNLISRMSKYLKKTK